MSWHNTAKSAGMPVEVNAVAVRWSNVQLPGEIPPLSGGGKSAEAIVVEETSRSADEHSKIAGRSHPMKGRTNEEGIDPATDKPTDNAPERGELESRGGGKHGSPQERTMIEDILEPENLAAAWKRVKANKGAPGIDGMTVEDFPAFARVHWPRIASAIREGTYRPAPVKRVWIPKPDGSQRPLGIPTVLDRVIQQAIAQVLGPLFEADFSEHSYGYRPGRSAHQAVAAMETGWQEGRRHAVECDLKSFFDTVNHDRLMNALRRKVRCPRVLGLIRRYLMAGVVLPDGTREATPQGVPQGGQLSPLLANIALDPLDKKLEARGHQFARYADDFIVLVKSANAAKRVLAALIRFSEGRLGLVVNRAKSRAAPLKQCAFLGYQIGRGAGPKLAPRLLSEIGSDRALYQDPQGLQCMAGTAPVNYQSGKIRKVNIRRRCNKHLHNAVHIFADKSRAQSAWAAIYYAALRERGMTHAQALRCLGQRWLKIIWKMWQSGTAYDAGLHMRNQLAHGSWVLKLQNT